MLELSFLKIPVSDLTRSVSFYEGALGFEKLFAAEEYGWAQMQKGELAFALYVPGKGGGNRSPGGSVDFQLHSADIEQLCASLNSSNPECGAEIFNNDDNSQSLEFKDPDGNEFKIMAGA